MEELIKLENNDLEHYKNLLLKRDALIKEAVQYENTYYREFGDLLTKRFETKITCIEKKKIISYCQTLINKGKTINQNEIDKMIDEKMKGYYDELKNIIERNKIAKNSKTINEYTLKKIKNIYYKIAKLIHPDMNPELEKDQNINELWNRTIIAYECNNIKDIEELEVLVNKYLESINYEGNTIDIPDLDEKIFELNEEIEEIINTNPYQYKYILMDYDSIEEEKQNIKQEINDYEKYANQLDEVIKQFNIERNYA